jgi:NAD(P)-dependent dehydrogenase (short-subunit alcohol dehydrogenase family)
MRNNVVLIFGGAAGIGLATSQYFLRQGWSVISADIAYEEDKFLESSCSQIVCDITSVVSLDKLTGMVLEQHKKVDVVVNSVGLGMIGELANIPLSAVDCLINVNVKGAIYAYKSTLPMLKHAKMGRYIQISSLAGKTAYPLSSVYCASKYAIEGLFESLRFELINDGISIHLVRPGRTDSDFGQSIKEHDGNSDEQRELIHKVRRHFDSSVKKSTSCQSVAAQIFRLATMESPPFSLACDKLTDFILKQRKKMTEDEWFNSVSKQFKL